MTDQFDRAKAILHRRIDLIAQSEFFLVEFWHVFRTTGILLANQESGGYRLFNGDFLRSDMPVEESSIARDSLDDIDRQLEVSWNNALESAKWQESIRLMNQI